MNPTNLVKNYAFAVLIFISFFISLTPIIQKNPSYGLDPSWELSISYASANNLEFGKEIIFTYGPYSSLYTKIYNKNTDFKHIFAGSIISLAYSLLIFLFISSHICLYLKLLIALIITIKIEMNSLMLLYPTMTCLIFTNKNFLTNIVNNKKYYIFSITLLFSALSILPLIKGSLLPACILALLFATAQPIKLKQLKIALLPILVFALSTLLFWNLSGQKLSSIDDYFINLIPIISGYTDAMSYRGKIIDLAFFLLIVGILSIQFYKNENETSNKITIFIVLTTYLFFSFKQGFVRHDQHIITSSTSILFASILSGHFLNDKKILITVIISSLFLYYTIITYESKPLNDISKIEQYIELPSHIYARTDNTAIIKNEIVLKQINNIGNLPTLNGTSDIYSYNQAILITSGNKWNPRPVFQSYSAYTTKMAQINANHLKNSNAPDHIFFRIEPIDNRLPALEDGASWPTLLSRYKPISTTKDYIILNKESENDAKFQPIHSITAKMNDTIQLGYRFPIFASIEIRQSSLGQIFSLIFKPSPLIIELETSKTHRYRFISNMAEAGFILSPLIETTNEFNKLYIDSQELESKIVKSFKIYPLNNKWVWNQSYKVNLYKLL